MTCTQTEAMNATSQSGWDRWGEQLEMRESRESGAPTAVLLLPCLHYTPAPLKPAILDDLVLPTEYKTYSPKPGRHQSFIPAW